MGPTQRHVSSPSQARDRISTISHTALITRKATILPRRAAQAVNTSTSEGKALRCACPCACVSRRWPQLPGVSQTGSERPFGIAATVRDPSSGAPSSLEGWTAVGAEGSIKHHPRQECFSFNWQRKKSASERFMTSSGKQYTLNQNFPSSTSRDFEPNIGIFKSRENLRHIGPSQPSPSFHLLD